MVGRGPTALAASYQWLDRNPSRYVIDLVYYLLHQSDTNGAEVYSPVRTVRVASPTSFVAQAYPNPANPAEVVALLVRTPSAGPAT